VSITSYTYYYASQYGGPEVDTRSEPLQASIGESGKVIRVTGMKCVKGRVYEMRLDGVKSADGEAMLHPEAYYTINELPR
jgi:hypothetical protein